MVVGSGPGEASARLVLLQGVSPQTARTPLPVGEPGSYGLVQGVCVGPGQEPADG